MPSGTVRAECFMLCDGAHALQGKLYVLGGGWNVFNAPQLPWDHSVAIAVRLAVPWSDANQRLPLRLDVVDEDGAAVVPEPLLAEFEVGRPAGMVANDEIPFVTALEARLTLTKETRIIFRLLVRDRCVAHTSFRVRHVPQLIMRPAPPPAT